MKQKTKLQKRVKEQKSNTQSFAQHLSELRRRLGSSLLFFMIGSVIGYLIHDQVLTLLTKPLNQPVFYTNPAGGFEFVFQISLFFGFLVSLPVFVYHIVRFIEPALPKRYPKLLFIILISSSLLLISGMAFAYFVSLPAALYFLNKFSTSEIQALISTSEYFSFVTRYLVGFGLVFQLPLIFIAINTVKKISTRAMLKAERWVILVSFILAAILTPTPDIFNQLIMALPLILLYQLTVVIIWLLNTKKGQIQKPS